MAHDLIIFDLDGTLVDSETLANRVFYEKLVTLGLDPAFDLMRVTRDFTGLTVAKCLTLARDAYGLSDIPNGFEAELKEATYASYRAALAPIPGVPAMLEQLRQLKCVASSSAPEKIAFSLELTGLSVHFGDNLFSVHHVAEAKPAPDVFLYAAEKMGGFPPAACAVVEDSLPGATAGIRAGMTVFAYRPDGDGDAFAAMGCHVFHDMGDLPALLG
ncbi:HAD family hydrolase [Ferrovibrio sp.]|uniref:HAD family hydrolase n=1 Tax=Ferrovibrio sp. TaxID=1917215 RepID=UPI0035B0DE80